MSRQYKIMIPLFIISIVIALVLFKASQSEKNAEISPSENNAPLYDSSEEHSQNDEKTAPTENHTEDSTQTESVSTQPVMSGPAHTQAEKTGTASQAPAITQSTPEPAVKKPELYCKKVSYEINSRVPAQVREKIQNFKTMISLPEDPARIDKTVCVRLDGTPVAFQKMKSKKNSLLIESGVNDQTKIEVSFCSGKGNCPFSCVIPKDDFLISLGGVADSNELDSLGKESAGWKKDQKLSAEEKELQKNSKEIKEIFAIGGEQDSKIFNGWTIKAETDVGCSNQAHHVSQR